MKVWIVLVDDSECVSLEAVFTNKKAAKEFMTGHPLESWYYRLEAVECYDVCPETDVTWYTKTAIDPNHKYAKSLSKTFTDYDLGPQQERPITHKDYGFVLVTGGSDKEEVLARHQVELKRVREERAAG